MRIAKAEKAKAVIIASIAGLARAESPDTVRPLVAGEINMAYKLGLIDYPERDHLMNNMVSACARRRNELHRAKLARLGIEQ